MLDKTAFIQQLESELIKKITLSHPIFDQVMMTKNTNLLKLMALQGYQLTLHFIDYIEKLYFYCPLESHKRKILYNLFEEVTGHFSKTKNHVKLMQDFLYAIGITDKERDSTIPLPETKQLITYRKLLLCHASRYHLAAAAIMIASEGQNLETKSGITRQHLLKETYQLTSDDLLFFTIHQKEDVAHTREGYELVADLCINEKMQKESLLAVRKTCDLFYNMYTGIMNQYQQQKKSIN